MTTGREKLNDDLRILEDMAGKMGDYLNSENLFWQSNKEGVPEPSIGQFLLRQHRLQALGHALCVAMLAAGANLVAAGNRIPGGLGPLDA